MALRGRFFNKLLQKAGIEVCSSFWDDEILIIQPQIIVTLGYYATRSILTKYNADPSSEEMSFKNINSKLLVLDEMKIFPLPHLSALLYNPSFEPGTIEKYSKLKSYL